MTALAGMALATPGVAAAGPQPRRRIKVLDVRDTHEIGGPGKTILETFRAIDATRFDMHLAVFLRPGESGQTPFLQAARAAGMPVHVIHGRNAFDPRLVWRLARLVRRLEIDILHPHEISSNLIALLAAKLQRVALVTTLHGWFGHTLKHRAYIALDHYVVRRYDRVIAVSRQIYETMAPAGLPPDRLRLLHNAIVLERYRRTGQRGRLAALVGRPVPSPVLASIGRLSREKGQADLLDALAIAAAHGQRVSLVLAGDGPERAALEEQAQRLGLGERVIFPGYVSQPQLVIEEADLVVLPSHTEGLPNAALEAMAMEVPLLATAVGGTPEVVTDGITGRLVAPRNPPALAAAILDFLADPAPWKRMAAAGRQAVEERFNFTARTRALETLYSEVGEVRVS